jgi:hypothetical protein
MLIIIIIIIITVIIITMVFYYLFIKICITFSINVHNFSYVIMITSNLVNEIIIILSLLI